MFDIERGKVRCVDIISYVILMLLKLDFVKARESRVILYFFFGNQYNNNVKFVKDEYIDVYNSC